MTQISPLHAADRFALMHHRQRQLLWHDRAARALVVGGVIAAALIAGYLIGITTATAAALPQLLADAATRNRW